MLFMYMYLRSGPVSCHSSNSEAAGAHGDDEAGLNPAIAGQVMGGGTLAGQVVSGERLEADACFLKRNVLHQSTCESMA